VRASVLVGTLDGSLHSIGLSTGVANWSAKTGDAVYSSPLLVGDDVYVTSTDKHVYVLNRDTGDIRRCVPVNGRIYASPRLIEGRVYFGSTAGIIYEIDLANYAISGQVQLPERITDPIAYSALTGLYYARSQDGQIYAFRRVHRKG